MKEVLDESKVESASEARKGCACTCCAHDASELGKRMERAVDDAKAVVSAKLEDGKFAAERLLKRGQYAVEDGLEEAAHNIKRNPFGSLAIAFAAGAALALLVPRATKK
jgi:ElaB/YqjD/DUF883 family membrane-anchored ribosome-binding protein